MKKFLFLLILGVSVFGTNAFAEDVCNKVVPVTYDSQAPGDDEFLYASKDDYEAALKNYKKDSKSGNVKVYECDKVNSGSCTDGQVVTLAPGHYFQGKPVSVTTKYECKARAMANDKWVAVEQIKAPKVSGCTSLDYGFIEKGHSYATLLTKEQCKNATIIDDSGTKFALTCVDKGDSQTLECWAAECMTGSKPENGKCVPLVPSDGEKKGNTCVTRNCAGLTGDVLKECTACCGVKTSVAKWTNNKCVCSNAGEKFVINSNGKTGVCIPEKTEETEETEKFTCADKLVSELKLVLTECDNSELNVLVQQFVTLCQSGITREEYDTLYSQVRVLIEETCPSVLEQDENDKDENVTTETKVDIIKDAGAALNAIFEDFDVSVWRDAEGKFNTARLASDSIAAVVLGTAGGLITSSVMKKHQVEDGFEDLQCTVGGQPVAGYGDEFRVGIQ